MTIGNNGGNIARTGTASAQPYGSRTGGGPQPANLGDILERVLDTGIVIAGDIQVNLLDIELLTIKLRLVIASVDTARQLGIDWWRTDPWLSSKGQQNQADRELAEENRRLRERLAVTEGAGDGERPQVAAEAVTARQLPGGDDSGAAGRGGDQTGDREPAGKQQRDDR